MMVESRLDGETLTATFHFKDIPERMGLNREGMPFSTFEYFHTVNTNTIPMFRFTLHRNPYRFNNGVTGFAPVSSSAFSISGPSSARIPGSGPRKGRHPLPYPTPATETG